MKIAIAFLLLGLSSSFADNSLGCPKDMTLQEANAGAQTYMAFVVKYQQIKASGNEDSPKNHDLKTCLVISVFDCVDFLSRCMSCDRNKVFAELLQCLNVDANIKIYLETCYTNYNYSAAARVDIPIATFNNAMGCLLVKLYGSQGLDLAGILNGLVPNAFFVVFGIAAEILEIIAEGIGTTIDANGNLVSLVLTSGGGVAVGAVSAVGTLLGAI